MFGANLVIPAQTCDELSCGRGKVYDRTDRQTDGRTDRRRQRQYPFGLKAKGKKRDHRMFINTMLLCYKSCLYLHFKPTSQEACRRSWSALRLSRLTRMELKLFMTQFHNDNNSTKRLNEELYTDLEIPPEE